MKEATLVSYMGGDVVETTYNVEDIIHHNTNYRSISGNFRQKDKQINVSPKEIHDSLVLYRYFSSMISCQNYQPFEVEKKLHLKQIRFKIENIQYVGYGLNMQHCLEHCLLHSIFRFFHKIVEIDRYIYDVNHNQMVVYVKVAYKDNTTNIIPLQLEDVEYIG